MNGQKKVNIPIDELIKLRREVHQNPEVSCDEEETAKRIMRFIEPHKPDEIIMNLGGHGVAAIYNGEEDGETVLIRGDIDALPIQEINAFDYMSLVPGVSHKCGHDGHLTIIAGLSSYLSNNRPAKGRVVLLFQPAEENGMGAKAVIEDEKFERIKPTYAFALHNLPGYPLHEVVYKNDSFTAAATSIIVKLNGKTAHAAEPEKGHNPALAIAEILQKVEDRTQPDITQVDFRLSTPVYLTMGEKAYGISAGYGEVHLTLRTWNNEVMDTFKAEVEEIALSTAKKYRLKPEISWTQTFAANVNDDDCVEIIKKAAEQNGYHTTNRQEPFKWGEDFGLFTQKIKKGAMFGIGSGGNTPALHNPDYDFPDEIIETGVKMFSSIIDKILNN